MSPLPRGRWRRSLWALIGLGLLTFTACDPSGRAVIRVRFDGRSLPNGQFEAALLQYVGPKEARPGYVGKPLPGLDKIPLNGPDGGQWTYCAYNPACGIGENHVVTFLGIRSFGGARQQVRLAVYLSGQDRVFLTEPVATKGNATLRLEAELFPDRTGTLVPEPPLGERIPRNLTPHLLPWLALLLVVGLAVELGVAGLWAWLQPPPGGTPRLLLALALGNVLTLPVVGFVGIVGDVEVGLSVGITWVVLAQLVASLPEWGLLVRPGRMPVVPALLLSFTANFASLLPCGLLVWLY